MYGLKKNPLQLKVRDSDKVTYAGFNDDRTHGRPE